VSFYWVRGGGVVIHSPLRAVLFDSNGDIDGWDQSESTGTAPKVVLVTLFEYKKLETRDTCFRSIGNFNRACVRFSEGCNVGTHKTRKADILPGAIHICCPTRDDCIFLAPPCINVLDDDIPECVLEFLHSEKRSVKSQIQLLSSLPSEDELLDEAEVEERLQAIHQQTLSSVQFGRTPAKGKLSNTRLWDVESGLSSGTVEGGLGMGMSTKLQGIINSMEEVQEEDFSCSPSKSAVSKSVSELAGLLQIQGEAIKGIEKGTNAMTSRVESSRGRGGRVESGDRNQAQLRWRASWPADMGDCRSLF
jgi:hypothetical protein